jgi:hypothetical protein
MPDTRTKPERDSLSGSRAERRDAALFAQYIHELSDRHGAANGRPVAVAREPGDDGNDEGG